MTERLPVGKPGQWLVTAPANDSELCHRCRRVPMVTTVSDGAREVALCLDCLWYLADMAHTRVGWSIDPKDGQKEWREMLKTV